MGTLPEYGPARFNVLLMTLTLFTPPEFVMDCVVETDPVEDSLPESGNCVAPG